MQNVNSFGEALFEQHLIKLRPSGHVNSHFRTNLQK